MKLKQAIKHHRFIAVLAIMTTGTLQAEVPSPDPASFATPPTSAGENVITMTASVPTSPIDVDYYFTETSGNPGGDDSGWQASPSYNDGGLVANTLYTYTVKTRDLNIPADETTESAGASATTDADNGSNALVHEPFAYDAGGLNSASGAFELGLDGSWNANSTSLVTGTSLAFGPLPTDGGSIGGLGGGSNRFGGARSVSASALSANGLLDDGAILWFSAIMGYDIGGNRTNSRLLLVLGDESLNTGNFNYWLNGSGTTALGVTLGRFGGGNGRIVATQARDTTFGDGTAGNVYGDGQGTGILPGSPNTSVDAALVVGKITWGATPSDPDTVELFLPSDVDLAFPDTSTPHSTLSVTVDQSGYDTISWCRGDKVVLDEIRFGGSYYDVIDADVVTTPDVDIPVVDPASFAVLPTAIDDARVTMTATVANDPSEVEYLFTETTGNPGATSSGWQTSPIYLDDGLSPSTMYSYTVQVRDKSVANNTGTASAAADVTTPAVDSDPPTPDPMTFAVNPAAISDTEISMTATIATDNTYGVEYLFTNTTLATNSGWQSSETWTETGLTPNTPYSYTVTARDTGPLNNEGTASAPEAVSTLPTDNNAPSPDPATWASAPTAVSDTEVTMTATTATDDQYGVEYYFTNHSVPSGANDSGWQASPTYNDTGLSPSASYTYSVKVRDTSYANNETAASVPSPAVTNADPAITTPSLVEGLFYTIGSQNQTSNGPPSSTNVDISVVDGKAIYSGVGNWPNQSQAGSWLIYNFFGDGTVADYKFFAEDGTSGAILNYAAGAGGIIADVTTADTNVDDAPWADVWTTADPGFDFLANGADFTSDTFMTQVAGTPAIEGDIDISGMTEGIVYVLYGAYRNRPNVDIVMSGNGQPDVTLDNIGDNDSANNNENYVCSFSFHNAGDYDTISIDFNSSNGRFLGVVVDGDIAPPTSDYDDWAALFPAADLADPVADLDGDGLTNDTERLFGLDPTDPASQNPIAVPLDAAAGTLSFTRRDDALTGLFSGIEASTDLVTWTRDSGAVLTPGAPDANDVETVVVTLSPGLLGASTLFVRVVQDEGTLLSENFEDSNGGFTATGTPNDWAWGPPNSINNFLTVDMGNGESAKAWGTNLGDGSDPSGGIDTNAVSVLRSPDINLAGAPGAELRFAAAGDVSGSDTIEVLVKDVTSGSTLVTVPFTIAADTPTDWTSFGPFDISAAVGSNVYLEFRFVGADTSYLGLYIDDVTVQQTMP